ncbi:MAG: hypothetical protein WA584_04995 [Pyrinomonadaceae bacterium]
MKKRAISKKGRESERGAALVTVLLISLLLLAAGSVLLLEASLNTVNVTDATAEQQAYNAAESGIQSALDVLRGNVPASPLFDTSKPATDPVNRIDFKKAINLSYSNAGGDTSTDARLSRWITYSATNPDRVTLGTTTTGATTYNPASGFAYSIAISDPDNTTNVITYRTSGSINGAGSSITFGSGSNSTVVSYVPKPTTVLDVSSGSANTDFGKFAVVKTGSAAITRTRFVITVFMTAPYNSYKEIRGYIEAGSPPGNVNFLYDSKIFNFNGSTMTINTPDNNYISQPNSTPRRFGYLVSGVVGNNDLLGSMTPAEPIRLLIRSTGYGPRNAKKQLEAIVQKNFFNGLSSPATLLLIGGGVCSVFNPGSSNATEYSGNDVASTAYIPPIGTTDNALLTQVNDSVDGSPPHPFNGDVIGEASNVSGELPFWLQTAANLHSTMMDLKSVATASGRYFASGVPVTGGIGNVSTAKGITYIDGNFSYGGSGGGILVVTGTLTLNGGFDFNGLIIVTGTGGVVRNGGGNGNLQGNIIIAPYNPANTAGGFLCPKYDLSGGGNSTIQYNSSSVANGQTAVSNFVLGVAEK